MVSELAELRCDLRLAVAGLLESMDQLHDVTNDTDDPTVVRKLAQLYALFQDNRLEIDRVESAMRNYQLARGEIGVDDD